MTLSIEAPIVGLALLLSTNDAPVNDALRRGLERCGARQTIVVDSSEEALRAMKMNPSIVFFPLSSARVNGKRIERVLHAGNPRAPLVAFGPKISSAVAFRLASLGVAGYLEQPFQDADVAACVGEMALPEDRLVRIAQLELGVRDMKEAQRVLRLSMCAEALRQSGGSRRAAARILGVDRRAVQKIAEELKETSEVPAFVPPARMDSVPPLRHTLRDPTPVPRRLGELDAGAKA